MRRNLSLALVATGAIVVGAASAPAATSYTGPSLWKNCTNVHKRYPHGVGKRRAHDHTSGTPVTNFRRSTVLYNRAMRYNKRLDADKDGIACEKA